LQAGYKYKYNGKELQDEMGLNMMAMDYRQYDPAIGRFNSMDVLSELAFSITPYRFAYNNPIYFSDPTGLFETKDEAKKWAQENGIRTGWFSSSKIEQGEGGTWAVNNKKKGTSHSAVNAADAEAMGINEGDVVTSVLIIGESKKKENDPLDFTIWGTDRSGDTSGRKGSASHSLESTDFVTPSKARSLNNKTTGIWEWLMSLIYNASTTGQHTKAIQDNVKKSGNTSTMETHNSEPIVKGSVEIATYHFHLNDSTVTKSTNTVNFSGTASDVKRQVDSTNNRNENRNSDKEAWLSSWGK
jgi:RHS repeat-associated protein